MLKPDNASTTKFSRRQNKKAEPTEAIFRQDGLDHLHQHKLTQVNVMVDAKTAEGSKGNYGASELDAIALS